VVERERERAARLEDAVRLLPARGEEALVVGVRVVGMARAVRDRLERLRRVLAGKNWSG
jgi:hypothetical protein